MADRLDWPEALMSGTESEKSDLVKSEDVTTLALSRVDFQSLLARCLSTPWQGCWLRVLPSTCSRLGKSQLLARKTEWPYKVPGSY